MTSLAMRPTAKVDGTDVGRGGPFSCYPVSPWGVREQATSIRGGGVTLDQLASQVQRDHRGAVTAVEGTLLPVITFAIDDVLEQAGAIGRQVAWASCQLEEFAEAIYVFNETSVEPRSVSKLNAAYWAAYDDDFGQPAVDYPPNASEGDRRDADTSHQQGIVGAKEALMHDLRLEYQRLVAQLDNAAEDVSHDLEREPIAAQIRAAWRSGNLPVYAPVLWPDLALDYDDLVGVPADIKAMSAGDLADYILEHPELDSALYARIAIFRSDAIDELGRRFEEWTLDPDGHPFGLSAPWGCLPNGYMSGGYLTGPDGLPYPVVVPEPSVCPEGETCISSPTGITGADFADWTTTGTNIGDIVFGDEVDASTYFAIFLAGGTTQITDWTSVGPDQLDYTTFYGNGVANVADGTEAPFVAATPETGDQPEPHPWQSMPARTNIDRATGSLQVLTSAMNAYNDGQQIENNRHYSYEVVFQESEAGVRRAVILLNQVQTDGEDVQLVQAYGTIDEDGNVVPDGYED